MGIVLRTVCVGIFLLAATAPLYAQAVQKGQAAPASSICLGESDVNKLLAQLQASQNVTPNMQLRDELLALKAENITPLPNSSGKSRKKNAAPAPVISVKEKTEARLCSLLKENGWFTISLAGKEGSAAAMFLLKSATPLEMQVALLPVIAEAVKKNEIERDEAYASFIDRLRLESGRKQLFGTQTVKSGDFLVLEPIEDEAGVDARRKFYGMAPLAQYMKSLELEYKTPMIKSPVLQNEAGAPGEKNIFAKGLVPELLGSETPPEDEVIAIDTNLVSLDVSVHSAKVKTETGTLEQKDFRLFEDGREEKITFFARANVPFDLVLLLDLSGSTSKKTDLIRQSTARFIDAARPVDRLAIVTFATEVNVVAPLTSDHAQLLQSANNIKNTGFSRVWDALKFTLENVLGPKTLERRRAVVFMTDGRDSSMMSYNEFGSKTTFAELLETVRKSEAAIFPIFLDTEGSDSSSPRAFRNARATLDKLTEESGGFLYKAKKLEDLKGVYRQVLDDLSRVYSIGYVPTDERRNGQWRAVKVEIPLRRDLIVHTRAGYYAN